MILPLFICIFIFLCVYYGCAEPFARIFRAGLTEDESHPHGDRAILQLASGIIQDRQYAKPTYWVLQYIYLIAMVHTPDELDYHCEIQRAE
jgi:hypothetical protein